MLGARYVVCYLLWWKLLLNNEIVNAFSEWLFLLALDDKIFGEEKKKEQKLSKMMARFVVQ